MKKKVIVIIIGLVIAGGSLWYIFNGGKDTTTDNTNNTASGQSDTASTEVVKDSLPDIIAKQKDLKIFNELIISAGMQETLQGTGPFTVLAPNDAAFKALPDGVLDTLKKPENAAMLKAVISYHIVKGNLASTSFQNAQKLPTVNGQEVIVEVSDGTTTFISAKGDKAIIKKADTTASNGTVQVVSAVLLPQ